MSNLFKQGDIVRTNRRFTNANGVGVVINSSKYNHYKIYWLKHDYTSCDKKIVLIHITEVIKI